MRTLTRYGTALRGVKVTRILLRELLRVVITGFGEEAYDKLPILATSPAARAGKLGTHRL